MGEKGRMKRLALKEKLILMKRYTGIYQKENRLVGLIISLRNMLFESKVGQYKKVSKKLSDEKERLSLHIHSFKRLERGVQSLLEKGNLSDDFRNSVTTRFEKQQLEYLQGVVEIRKSIDSLEKKKSDLEEKDSVKKYKEDVEKSQAFDILKKEYKKNPALRKLLDQTHVNMNPDKRVHYADMFVWCGDKVLLLKRSSESSFMPDVYGLPGGHVDPSEVKVEGWKEAAIRELLEETNIKVNPENVVEELVLELKDCTIHYYSTRFTSYDQPTVTLDNKEHSNYQWVNKEEISKLPLLTNLLDIYNDLYVFQRKDLTLKEVEETYLDGVSNGRNAIQVAEYHDVPVEDIIEQLKLGVRIEFEHTSNPDIAERIALDHLMERPNYYTAPMPENWAEKELEDEGRILRMKNGEKRFTEEVEIEKGRSKGGVYKDNPENRKKGRVGQPYTKKHLDITAELQNIFKLGSDQERDLETEYDEKLREISEEFYQKEIKGEGVDLDLKNEKISELIEELESKRSKLPKLKLKGQIYDLPYKQLQGISSGIKGFSLRDLLSLIPEESKKDTYIKVEGPFFNWTYYPGKNDESWRKYKNGEVETRIPVKYTEYGNLLLPIEVGSVSNVILSLGIKNNSIKKSLTETDTVEVVDGKVNYIHQEFTPEEFIEKFKADLASIYVLGDDGEEYMIDNETQNVYRGGKKEEGLMVENVEGTPIKFVFRGNRKEEIEDAVYNVTHMDEENLDPNSKKMGSLYTDETSLTDMAALYKDWIGSNEVNKESISKFLNEKFEQYMWDDDFCEKLLKEYNNLYNNGQR